GNTLQPRLRRDGSRRRRVRTPRVSATPTGTSPAVQGPALLSVRRTAPPGAGSQGPGRSPRDDAAHLTAFASPPRSGRTFPPATTPPQSPRGSPPSAPPSTSRHTRRTRRQ